MMTRLEAAICGRQGSRIICSICSVYLHLFNAFGREVLSFPKPTSWERPEGALLERAGRPPGPLCSRGCCPLPCRMGARRRIEVGRHLAKCVRGKAGPAAGDRGFMALGRAQGLCTSRSRSGLRLAQGARSGAAGSVRLWGPAARGPVRLHLSAGGKRRSCCRQCGAGSSQPPLEQRVHTCGLGARCGPPHMACSAPVTPYEFCISGCLKIGGLYVEVWIFSCS